MGRVVRLLAAVLVTASLAGGTATAAPRTPWSWPLRPAPAVAREFQPPPSRWAPGHRGVDLVASVGQQVLAPADGVVAFAGRVVDRGVLSITHATGLRTTYEPVDALVGPGAVVARGQPVARVAAAAGHCARATCLHWGARRGGVYLDPLSLLRTPEPPVLLPLAGAVPGTTTAARRGAWPGTVSPR